MQIEMKKEYKNTSSGFHERNKFLLSFLEYRVTDEWRKTMKISPFPIKLLLGGTQKGSKGET